MPRKTVAEIEQQNVKPEPDTFAYWQKEQKKAQTEAARLQSEHRRILIDKARAELIPQGEVREVFSRVFAAYRQATQEIDRRYGPEAAAILIQAERSALRAQSEDTRVCETQDKKRASGTRSAAASKQRARSRSSRKPKS